jgi:hypothetical protein
MALTDRQEAAEEAVEPVAVAETAAEPAAEE